MRGMPGRARWQRVLAKELGRAAAAALVEQAAVRYRVLYAAQAWPANRVLGAHLARRALPLLALYQVTLERGYDRPAGLALAARAFEAPFRAQRRPIELLGRLPFFFDLTRLIVHVQMRAGYPQEGWTVEWVEDSPARLAFNVRRCFLLETFRAHGAEELGAVLCASDDILADGVWPHMRWGRTGTLARGDPCCDFDYRRADRAREERGA